MRHKTAVRLALKVLGVFLIARGLAGLGSAAVYLAGLVLELLFEGVGFGSGAIGLARTWAIAPAVESGLEVLFGLYLFYGGRRIVDRIIPSNRPYCAECGYELTGLPPEGLCPECGVPFRRPAPRPAVGTYPEVPR